MNRADHWNHVYTSRPENGVSWFEPVPAVSLAMLDAAGVTPDMCVIDIGGGDSRLVDHLIQRGFTCLAVLDVSAAAIERAKARLGEQAAVPRWISADVAGEWDAQPVDVWHDRAVLHFLIDPGDRARYLAHLKLRVKPGGTVILSTFALDGPETCSGLPVARYSPEDLAATLGDDFRLVEWRPHMHQTPWGGTQSFQYSRFKRSRSA
jgi:2-polyprenyl-3-methyl-5-hydroxy-6-metoxy-1,4-benzoquinol methylase